MEDLKTTEDLEAEIQLLEEENGNLKAQIEDLKNQLADAVSAPAETREVKSAVGECFEYAGDKYKILVNSLLIPGLGKKTALEILVDEEAQAYLVNKKSSFIRKMV